MKSILPRAVVWSALGCIAGTIIWSVLGALTQPAIEERLPLAFLLRDLPYAVLYIAAFAGMTGVLLFLPYVAVISVIEWRRARDQAPYLTAWRMLFLGLGLAAPAAVAVAASFAYSPSPFGVDWDMFLLILPHAVVTFWAAAVLPPVLLRSLRAPARTNA